VVGRDRNFVLLVRRWHEVPVVDKVEVKVYFIIRFNFKVYFSDYPPSPVANGIYSLTFPPNLPSRENSRFPDPFPRLLVYYWYSLRLPAVGRKGDKIQATERLLLRCGYMLSRVFVFTKV
jgi:hypothetical protein